MPRMQGLGFRLVWRSALVVLLAFWAICMPFFGAIIGLVGALGECGSCAFGQGPGAGRCSG